jgi:OFA family oxalate/formate antiporter-like MFS transporter
MTTTKDKKTSSSTRWQVLIGAIIIQLILGTVYGYSIFWQPLQAEIFPTVITEAQQVTMEAADESIAGMTVVADEAAVEALQTTQRGYLKYAFSICILSFAFVMVLAGRLQDVMGPRIPAIIGGSLMGIGFMLAGSMSNQIVFYLAHAAFTGATAILLLMLYHALSAKVDKEQFPMLQYVPMGIIAAVVTAGITLGNQYLSSTGEMDRLLLLWGTIGFLAGSGIGFAYVCPIAALVKWFPKHKGLVSGLAVAGFGFGAFILKDQTVGAFGYLQSNSIQEFFPVHGLICFVAITIGALLLRNPPGTETAAVAKTDSSWQDTLRRPEFVTLWLMFFSGALAGLMVIGIIKDFAGEQLIAAAGPGLDAGRTEGLLAAGAAAVGWLAIFNAVGRVVWGFVSDRVGRTGAFVSMFGFQAVMMFLLAGMNTELTLAVAASIVGFNFGGNFALFPSATADLFGAKNLGANYGWVFTSYGIAGVVGIAAGNMAKEMTGSYGAAFVLAGSLCIVSAFLAVKMHLAQKRQAAVTA